MKAIRLAVALLFATSYTFNHAAAMINNIKINKTVTIEEAVAPISKQYKNVLFDAQLKKTVIKYSPHAAEIITSGALGGIFLAAGGFLASQGEAATGAMGIIMGAGFSGYAGYLLKLRNQKTPCMTLDKEGLSLDNQPLIPWKEVLSVSTNSTADGFAWLSIIHSQGNPYIFVPLTGMTVDNLLFLIHTYINEYQK